MNPEQNAIFRMIDANLNRATEGIRVIEDCARFGLDDAELAQTCKGIRHQLRSAISMLDLPDDALITNRDTVGDVGTRLQTPGELNRAGGMRDLVSAASKRATQALRVIEESVKVLGHSGGAFESIRYRLYTIERQVILALAPPCPQWTLCVLVTQSLCVHHAPMEIIKRAAGGGAGCIQIREKGMDDGELLDHAGQLTDCAHDLGLDVIINDRADIAKLVGTNGVHLGQNDLPIGAARDLLGARAWIGRTCPTVQHAIEAIDQGADICGIGPVFSSTTKSKPILGGIGLVESYLEEPATRDTPMLAISGIDPTNIDRLAQIGCPGVAVSRAVCGSEDPEMVCRRIVEAIGSRPSAGELCP